MMKKNDQQLAEIRTDAQKTETKLNQKRQERANRKKADQVPLSERLIAPGLFLLTVLISYLILLFS